MHSRLFLLSQDLEILEKNPWALLLTLLTGCPSGYMRYFPRIMTKHITISLTHKLCSDLCCSFNLLLTPNMTSAGSAQRTDVYRLKWTGIFAFTFLIPRGSDERSDSLNAVWADVLLTLKGSLKSDHMLLFLLREKAGKLLGLLRDNLFVSILQNELLKGGTAILLLKFGMYPMVIVEILYPICWPPL